MKTHLIFCCNNKCAKQEMDNLADALNSYKISHSAKTIFADNKQYRFIVDINNTPEYILGYSIDSFKACSHYHLNDNVLSYLNTRWITSQDKQIKRNNKEN